MQKNGQLSSPLTQRLNSGLDKSGLIERDNLKPKSLHWQIKITNIAQTYHLKPEWLQRLTTTKRKNIRNKWVPLWNGSYGSNESSVTILYAQHTQCSAMHRKHWTAATCTFIQAIQCSKNKTRWQVTLINTFTKSSETERTCSLCEIMRLDVKSHLKLASTFVQHLHHQRMVSMHTTL